MPQSAAARERKAASRKRPVPETSSKEDRRWAVVHAWQLGGGTLRQIAAATGTTRDFAARWLNRFQATGKVTALPKPGRPKKLSKDQIAWADDFASKNEVYNCNSVAVALQSKFGTSVSAATVGRAFKGRGVFYRFLPPAPVLTAANKLARVQFARANARRAWKGVMFTDSKYFYTHPVKRSRGVKLWHRPSPDKVQTLPKHATGIHVYMGVASFGVTRLVFVTGTAGQKSPFLDKKGKALKGVGGQEYVEKVLPVLIEDGQRLFAASAHWSDQWTFQQDGAPAHRGAAAAAKINDMLPGRLLVGWPANSPDLSWIENIWAWMEQQLRRQPLCKTVDELKAAVQSIKENIPASMLQNCVHGMAARLHKVIELEGGHIGH